MGDERANAKYKDYLTKRLNKMFDDILFNVEPVVKSEYQYQVVRKRILRAGNNALRDLVGEVDYYSMREDGPRERKFDKLEVVDDFNDKE